MTSHGVPHGSGVQPATEQERRKEQQKIQDYKALVDSVNDRIQEHQFTTETLELTSRLLKWNPEYYTIWNHRRSILQHQFEHAHSQASHAGAAPNNEAVINLISDELAFLMPLLRKFPKCYWIWSYRLWLLENCTQLLSVVEARRIWQQELALAGKMLSLDSRNFHGWGYRRTVVSALERIALQAEDLSTSMTETEFEYTTKMINSNLSNFSAWHNRSKLIPRLLNERGADHHARRKFLDGGEELPEDSFECQRLTCWQELELIERALWAGSEDQSLWFYHQYLMCTFDPKYATESMVPELTGSERTTYVRKEITKVREMLDGAEDCKWIYQSLIHLSLLYRSLGNESVKEASHFDEYIDELTKLDPLRLGRWNDLKDQIKL